MCVGAVKMATKQKIGKAHHDMLENMFKYDLYDADVIVAACPEFIGLIQRYVFFLDRLFPLVEDDSSQYKN